MKSIRFHPDARVQLRQAIRYYADQEAGLGHRFKAAVDRALAVIRSNPEAGIRVDEFQLQPVRPFRNWIVFVPRKQHTWIIAVHHDRQDDSYWLTRIAEIDETV